MMGPRFLPSVDAATGKEDRQARRRTETSAGIVRVKVCGIRRYEDAALAVQLGAGALGFVFWPGSPRAIDAETVRDITRRLPAFVDLIGVFVNQEPAAVRDIASRAGLTAIQLHGDEELAPFASLGLRIIKAVAVRERFTLDELPSSSGPATLLLDAHDPLRRGGTGRTIDWTTAAAIARDRPVILSGGLTPENVRRGIETVRPYAVDVSSGVEAPPGLKDEHRLRAFFEAVRPR